MAAPPTPGTPSRRGINTQLAQASRRPASIDAELLEALL
jgi:hypothetical protein